ncbi:hypothetical protein EW146_g3255 [Bondarzewia mesenterica]|uniref:DUF6697 domain-containing protein n=1 Tax=Bondarzewia mesenterica TaxID=1095465 RepID=A0A4S4LY40_9AGAM|nr:hypothetical protein EW146_g3255 [Bondarzewia mesenterica]
MESSSSVDGYLLEIRELKVTLEQCERRNRELEAEIESLEIKRGEGHDGLEFNLSSPKMEEQEDKILISSPHTPQDGSASYDTIKSEATSMRAVVKKRSLSHTSDSYHRSAMNVEARDLSSRRSAKKPKFEMYVKVPVKRAITRDPASNPSTRDLDHQGLNAGAASASHSVSRHQSRVDPRITPVMDLDDPNDFQPLQEELRDNSPPLSIEASAPRERSRIPSTVSINDTQLPVQVKQEPDDDSNHAPIIEDMPVMEAGEVNHELGVPVMNGEPLNVDEYFVKPKIKKDMSLDAATVQSRILAAQANHFPITLDPAISSVTVTRRFMSYRYGGSSMEAFPSIAKRRSDAHGYKSFMYAGIGWHPNAPTRPGEPGLWYNSTPVDRGISGPYIVFVGLESGKWLYVGQYMMISAQPLSQTEWILQDPKVKRTWATHIRSQNWGRGVRVQIILRREKGREPTYTEMVAAWGSGNKYDDITADEIAQAYEEGKQRLGIEVLKCVGYDEQFQRELAETCPVVTYDAPPSKKKTKPSAAGKKGRRKTKVENDDPENAEIASHSVKGPEEDNDANRKKMGRRAKYVELLSSDEREGEGAEEDVDEDEDDEEPELQSWTYTKRGTRSRPLIL